MTPKSIIELQLEAEFGNCMPSRVQTLVDNELNAGVWREGYDLAVNPSGLNHEEGEELLGVVLSHFPDLRINRPDLTKLVDSELPQSEFSKVLWLVADDLSFCVTDSLRVVRFNLNGHLWTSPRISYDGISLEYVQEDKLFGNSFSFDTYNTDLPFVMDWKTGSLLKGEVIEL